MIPTLHYINLKYREDRHQLMQKNWGEIVRLNRIEAFDMRSTKEGVKGCFLSQQLAFETAVKQSNQQSFIEKKGFIIAEDDIIPCIDFSERLNMFLKELPKDCDVFMLGYSVNPNSGRFSKVSKHICKAENHVLAGHCYMIHPNFYDKYLDILATPKIHEYNFDAVLQHIQTHHNVYMAMPAMCYQYSSYSDNSYMVVGNTELTQRYFKDKL